MERKSSIMRYVVPLLLFPVFFLSFPPILCRAEDMPSEVVLDADDLSYDEHMGTATAEGNARLRYENIRVHAARVEMNVETGKVMAEGNGTNGVTIMHGGRRLVGRRLDYDVSSREGVLADASGVVAGKTGTLYLRGREVEVAPAALARAKGWLSGKSARGVDDEAMVARWDGVSTTTCSSPRPHYRLETKRLIIVPGKRVVAKSPRVYIGESMLFTYPFDYVVDLRDSASLSRFLPDVGYMSDKGAGIGLSGPLVWDSGSLKAGFMYWENEELEWRVELDQKVNSWLSIYARTVYEYSEVANRKDYRPSWGARFAYSGWSGSLSWSQREIVEIEKSAGNTYKGTLWREPEFYLSSPWWRGTNFDVEYFRLHASWGEYEERADFRRTGWGAETYGELREAVALRPFWKAAYRHYDYDDEIDTEQKVTDVALGVKWRLGSVDAGTAYVRRWVDGRSPMRWDNYADDERKELYQQFSFSIGRGLGLMLRGAYDLDDSHLDEMVYRFSYDNDCCMRWELLFRDDLENSSGNDDWASLRVVIKAFPDGDVKFGSRKLEDPFAPPSDLKLD